MKRKTLLLFAIASIMMLAIPTKAWAEGVKTSQKSSTSTSSAEAAFTENGVKYGYFGDELSSDNMDEMKQILAPWVSEFANLDIDGILAPDPDDETWYMQIVGVDNETIDKRNGEMRIYNDIGSTWDYKTISIDGTALRNNEHIKKIVFEDCASGSANAGTRLKMVIHDGAFQGCKNLKEISMYYFVTEGTNYYDKLYPTDVYIGSNVFDGCHEDFRIVVDLDVYDDFVKDPNWGKYADKIVAQSHTPSADKPTIIKGVKYGYFGNQLSSNDSVEMRQIVEPWTAEFRNLDMDLLLEPDPDDETWYMQIVGVDDSYIQKSNGEMRIFNDIGDTYDYKTISIDRYAMSGNEYIEKVVFEDCASSSANAGTRLKLAIHDGAFKDCKNLKEFNMYYYVTEGTNRYEMLYPWDIYVGENVFDGCHEDFRITVAPQLYDMFVNDPNWCQYADMIVASDYLPTDYDPIVFEDVTYDYAAKSLNTLPTSELTRLQSSWWNAVIIGVEVAMIIATAGTFYGATEASVKASTLLSESTARTLLNTAERQLAEAAATLSSKVTQTSFLMSNGAGVVPRFATDMQLHLSNLAANVINAAATYDAANAALMATLKINEVALAAAMSNYTYYMMVAGVAAATPAGLNGMDYVAKTVGDKARRNPTWALQGQWLMTECKHTIYHMYVKDVENKETVTLYNDIGSAYNYKTVAIGDQAFHNKDKIKTIKFYDVNTGEMYSPMTILIPDSAFVGCKNLETLDLIMFSNYTNRLVPLGPENFIVCGEDIFAGCDTTKLKIRIGADKYEEFAENTFWGKYKNCFEVVDVPEKADYSEFGAQYSYSFENNTMKKQTYIGAHTIEHLHIIGQDEKYLQEHGELILCNDIGEYNNYKLDYVKKKAFYGNENLTGISMMDLKGAGGFGDSYTDLELTLQDSAFAYCPNLDYINMLYLRTDGTNSVEPMSPRRVQLGKGVFAGSDKLKVKMVTTALDEFKADTSWAKYEDRFLPSFIITEDETLADALEECGMEYSSSELGSFDVYDVMQVTDFSTLDGKFQGKAIESFREFKAFECNGLDHVGDSLFKDCNKLQAIELPSTIKSIGKQAFYNCALLDDVTIPDSVTSIQDEAFRNCAILRSITFLSEKPATLGANIFAGMPEDYILYVPAVSVETYKKAWPQYAEHIQTLDQKHTGIWEITLEAPGTLAEKLGLTITGTDPLVISGNYSKYDSLKIAGPMNGTDIGVIRFIGGRDVNNCEPVYAGNLRYLDIYDADIKAGGEEYNQDGDNDYITEDNCIDTYMFWELDKLETLILPKSVTKIKDDAFKNCDNLQRLVIGNNTKSIGEEVTHDSPKLREIIMLCDEAPATDSDAWSEDYPVSILYTPNSYREHISGSHAYYTRIDSIASPFKDDKLLHALSEKRIYNMFDIMVLKDFENVINNNTDIKIFNELVFAVSVSELGDNSLSGCSSLEEVSLPGMLDTITAGAFSGCTSLTKINVFNDTIPGLAPDAFKDLPKEFVIYVKQGMEEDYRKAWPQYADHIQGFRQLKADIKVVTVTESGTLGEALGFEISMSSANDVGRIGGDIISINALKVIGPINGKDIAVLRMLGGREEEDCEVVSLARMTYLDLYDATICTDPDNICFNRDGNNDYVEEDNVIPEHMFWMLDKLQTVILPKNVTKIDDNAFYDCLNIETIVVGDATTEIGDNAFGECPNLKNIVFLCNEKATLDSDAFTDPISDMPYQVEKMYIPHSLYQAYISDYEYTTHTKEFCTNYEDDALFRALGSHVVMTNDQLQHIANIDGWFKHHNEIRDLTSLEKTSIDTLKAATMAPLKDLRMIALPATLEMVEDNAFAENTRLQWADFSKCSNSVVLTQDNISKLGISEYALVYAPESFTSTEDLTNVIYGSEGDLRCAHLIISDNAEYAVPREFKAAKISYDRQFAENGIETICLPFNMEMPDGAKAYILTDAAAEYVTVSQVHDIIANKPFIIVTDKDMKLNVDDETNETTVPVTPNRMQQVSANHYAMLGTLSSISETEAEKQKMYVLGDDDIWHLVENANEGDTALAPYRVFMQAKMSGMPNTVYMIFDDNAYNVFTGNSSWNEAGNWSDDVPADNKNNNTLILGDVTLDEGDEVHLNDLLIGEGSLTIGEGAKLVVDGKVKNDDASSLVINDGAEIIIKNNVTRSNNNVAATFNMGIVNPENWNENGAVDGWQFIASPFVDAPISDFTEVEDNYDLYKYEGSSAGKEWDNQKNDDSFEGTFVNGMAYLASYESLDTASLTGNINTNTAFSKALTYTEGNDMANFHLLGNPFTFNMDMSGVTASGLVSGYAIIGADGAYIYAPADTTIAVGDGFFVKAIGENASLSYSLNDVVPATRGSEKANSINVIATGKAGKDNVVVNFDGKAEGFDKLQNFNDAIATVYVTENGKAYGIANVDENTSEVALSFDAKEMGQYTISLDVDGEFETVTLVDLFTGVETDMSAENEYTFTATGNDNVNRFVIRLANGQEPTANSQFVYQSGEELILSIEGLVQIVDMSGRVVYSSEHANGNNRIDVAEFNDATYVVRVINEEGVKTQKVVIY